MSDPRDHTSGATQDEPRLDQNDTTDLERLDGIVAQTRADLAGQDAASIEKALRGRLSDAQIPLDDDEIVALARDIAGGADAGHLGVG